MCRLCLVFTSANQSGVAVAPCGSVESLWRCGLLCQGGYACGDRYVTLLCDLFGGHSTTVMDGFADVSLSPGGYPRSYCCNTTCIRNDMFLES